MRPSYLVQALFLGAIYFISGSQISHAVAQTQTRLPALYDTPVYYAPEKKYVALINIRWNEMIWDKASVDAQKRVYKGVQGRLAIVDNVGVHNFLLVTFHPEWPSWIGLRYWCSRHKLEWSDGKFWESGQFQAWDRNWMQEVSVCDSAPMPNHPEQYMVITADPNSSGVFTWVAKGWYKSAWSYFIEFPTGQP